ncbi:hypothetical protein DY000_02048855 [Brassica cretica]|uniref:Transposase MuDR plant domain-containing protein n=1 Tax=Brassica cretica TaxID=69181 RepID=A0ABQ7EVA1_BRACR|nr:hypothetical protein DY000_02048855 [Brassica cretica]
MKVVSGFFKISFEQKYGNIYKGRLPKKSAAETTSLEVVFLYGEWLLKDGCWNFVVDKFKGARPFFFSESSTHDELVAMAQEDYNLHMNTESVELAYSLPEAMMQPVAPDTPPIYVKHKDEEEDDDMCFEDFKGTYGSEGGRSNANKIYVNQSFASRDALNIQVNKNSPCGTCHVNGCGWKIRASVKHGTNTFWVTKYVETHVGTEIRTVYFRLNKES